MNKDEMSRDTLKNSDEIRNNNFMKMNRRTFLKVAGMTAGALAFGGMGFPSRLLAQAAAQGAPLGGNKIPQFVDALPDLLIQGGTSHTLEMNEFLSPVMPSLGWTPANGSPYAGTYVWGYRYPGQNDTDYPYIGPVISATRGTPTKMTYRNNLGFANPAGTTGAKVNAWTNSTDQTLHWANPKGDPMMTMTNYSGPIPAVVHLHGGEVPPQLDGGPDAWFLSNSYNPTDYPSMNNHGHAYYSSLVAGETANPNEAIYNYPNTQEAANIWFHDHALGITRLNVYAGLAGAYLINDPSLTLPAGLGPHDIGGETIIPLVIQDRMFDVNGQLYFPNLGLNPTIHPFWIPEFVGDTIVVNGKVWPTIGTAPGTLPGPKSSKRYRFMFLNGSNARTYELFLVDPVSKVMGPPMWVIGTDGGYLDTPVKVDPNAIAPAPTKLLLMPGERYDVIIDFNDPAWRTANPGFSGTLILRNTGRTPFPRGAPPNGSTLGQIVKFFIGAPVADASYDPASGIPLRPASPVDKRIVRLVNTAIGTPAVTPQVTRQLTLNEVMGPLGPVEVLVNNTRWDGHSVATTTFPNGVRTDFTPIQSGNSTTYYSELPVEGQNELWEIVNMTADAHPIHLHLVQFQLMNRQNFNVNKYNKAYNALFPANSGAIDPMTNLPYPGGVFIGGYGPPLDYNTGAGIHPVYGIPILGGNPGITPYLQGVVMPPVTYEAGWKDTVIAYPGQVTRIMVRWAPTDLPASTSSTDSAAAFPFDPNGGHGYVWHCHIIDHEDNEMMRPDSVALNPSAPSAARALQKGTHY